MAVVLLDTAEPPPSWIRFTPDWMVLDSKIHEPHREFLAPLLVELRPTEERPDPPPCIIINGVMVPLPPGAKSGGVLWEPGPLTPAWWPYDYRSVNYRESVVNLTLDGILLHSDVSAQDSPDLQPLFDNLRLQVGERTLPIPPGADVSVVIHGFHQTPPPEGWPLVYLQVTLGDSWIKYLPNEGVLLDYEFGSTDTALAPVLEALTSP